MQLYKIDGYWKTLVSFFSSLLPGHRPSAGSRRVPGGQAGQAVPIKDKSVLKSCLIKHRTGEMKPELEPEVKAYPFSLFPLLAALAMFAIFTL